MVKGLSMKADNAYRTISEVADHLSLPAHVLRFWETKFPQIKPLKRGGGRRYYAPQDIALIECIRDLLHEKKYTIRGVQQLLESNKTIEDILLSEDKGKAPKSYQKLSVKDLIAMRKTLVELLQEIKTV